MVLVGRRLLPSREITREYAGENDIDYKALYDLDKRLVVLQLPPDSTLAGKTLAQSKLGSFMGLNVIAIIRDGQTQLAPDPRDILQTGDRRLVGGRLDVLTELQDRQHLIIEDESLTIEKLKSAEIEMVVTINTIKKHTSNIYGKLGVRSRTQAIARAYELNLL
jgi:hypothetical protein